MASCSVEEKAVPVGVFWDIENCSVPRWKSALHLVQTIRHKFVNGYREAEFICACDIRKESKKVILELNQAQVNIVHVDAVSKNAADEKLKQNIRRFSDTHSPPSRIVLISSDINFSAELHDLRYRKHVEVVLVHGLHVHDSLLLCATQSVPFLDLVTDLPNRGCKDTDSPVDLHVTGYSSETELGAVKSCLRRLSSNTGGKVINIDNEHAVIRFSTKHLAHRAKRRMEGQEVYGSSIHVGYMQPQHQYYDNYDGHYYNYEQNPDYTDNNGSNTNRNPNSSPNQPRPYSQSHRRNKVVKETKQTVEISPVEEEIVQDSSPVDTLLQEGVNEGLTEEIPESHGDIGIQDVVKKFSHPNKSSRQLLMLQQQIYQEEQTPLTGNSTQFYSHVTKLHTHYDYGNQGYGHQGYGNHSYGNQWQPQDYQQQYYQPNEQSGYYNQYGNCSTNYQASHPTQSYHGNKGAGFQPIRSASPSESSVSSSPVDFNSEEYPGAVDLLISNLDYNISPKEWKSILTYVFQPTIKVLCLDVSLQPDNTSLGVVKLGSMKEARYMISQFHRKKIGYKRIHVTLPPDSGAANTASTIRSEAISLLNEAKDNVLPLFKFIELFNKRFDRSVSIAELYKMKDTIEIREQKGAGRMIHLAQTLKKSNMDADGSSGGLTEDSEVRSINESVVCQYHCPEGSPMFSEATNTAILPNVKVHLKTFAPQLHFLLTTHNGDIPLMSFPACFNAEVGQLVYVYEGGVPLEHVISCVPGIQIVLSSTGVKKISWAENKTPGSPEPGSLMSANGQHLDKFARDMGELLRQMPYCRLPYTKFIAAYHQHFHRQCRVADFGYSKLMELFDAIPHVVQVLGMGDRKMLTLTHKAQVKRFTVDVQKLLKSIQGKQLYLTSLAEEFSKFLGRPWDITEYGVTHLDDILTEIPSNAVLVTGEGDHTVVGLPRIQPTYEEVERLKQFSLEIVDLLRHHHQCRLPFSKFIPAYHHHFGRQCRISDYGYSKLQDLLEALPQVIAIDECGDEKIIHLTEGELRKVVGDQIVSLFKNWNVQSYPLDQLMRGYYTELGYYVPLQDLHVHNPQQLMAKLKHVVKLELYNDREYVVLSDRTSAPPLARQVLQLLMDQSGGSLPLMELCSRYKTTFGNEPNTTKIKEELLDYVQVSGDDESGVISLTPLQTVARDLRILLRSRGKICLADLEQVFFEHFGQEINPGLYGFPSLMDMLMAIPHVVSIKGRGTRPMVHLSGDLQGALPIIDESYSSVPDSDTPSNDSGSALTDEDTPTEPKKPLPDHLMDDKVPSSVPSPVLHPDLQATHIDLIKFDFSQDYRDAVFASLCDEEKTQQQSPLVRTPTSQLLHYAAQHLPPLPDQPSEEPVKMQNSQTGSEIENQTGTTDIAANMSATDVAKFKLEMLKQGWWNASPSQLSEISNSIKNAGIAEHMAELKLDDEKPDNDKSNHINVGEEEKEEITQSESTYKQCKIQVKGIVETDVKVTQLLPEPDNCDNNNDDDEISDDYKGAVKSLSATLKILRRQHETEVKEVSSAHASVQQSKASPVSDGETQVSSHNEKLSANSLTGAQHKSFPPQGSQPWQPGSYWYSKQFQSKREPVELPDRSPEDVRKVLASLSHQRQTEYHEVNEGSIKDNETATPQQSIDISESNSAETLTEGFPDIAVDQEKDTENDESFTEGVDKATIDFKVKKMISESTNMDKGCIGKVEKGKSSSHTSYGHKLENCVAEDCMCYEVVFRRDHPIETSSLKSDSSFTESFDSTSPIKVVSWHKMSTSSLSDDSSINSSINHRKSRIAAKFTQSVEQNI